MAIRKEKNEILAITGPISFEDIESALNFLDINNVKVSRAKTLYMMKNGKKINYSLNQIIKTINNDIKNNVQKLTTLDVESWEVAGIFESTNVPKEYKIVTPWNENGKKEIEIYRQNLLDYSKSLGYQINDEQDQYTAIRYKNQNFAEIHNPDKDSKIRIDVFFDRLPENIRNTLKLERYPDNFKYSLNGKFMLTLDEKTYEQISNLIEYMYKNGDEIKFKKNIKLDSKPELNESLDRIDTSNISLYKNEDNNKENEMLQQPKNQILYGPPGTGKTYNTVLEAMKIIEPKLIQYDANDNVINYSLLKEKFDEYKKQGRIEFVTFHQSYSYEEFVEGIKPVLNAENIIYEKKEGAFKRICNNSKMISTDKTTSEIDFSKTRIFKLSLGRKNGDDTLDIFNYCIENNVIALGWGEDRDFSSCSTPEEFQKVDASWGAKAVEIFKNWMRIGDIVLISDGLYSIKAIARLTGDYSYRTDSEIRYCQFREVEWLYVGDNIPVSKFNSKNLSQQTIYGFYNSDLENSDNYHPTLNTDFINQIITGEINNAKQEPYVLIIDEINRGNISKIFGELITLIEEDKRLGEANEVTLKLPYSDVNDPPFGVPSNLYIIGTMNTSDRSIASVDIALRRRFKFKEMMPKSDLVADFRIGFSNIFKQLNQRISILLDRDHQIGHSYFIKDKYKDAGVEELKQIWFDSILPLLNEYFYGDWEKLQKLLGCAKKDSTSFITKLDEIQFADDTKLDDEENCFDFTDKENINFSEAMKHAFKDVFKVEEKND